MKWLNVLTYINYQFCYEDNFLYILSKKTGKILKPTKTGGPRGGYYKIYLINNNNEYIQMYYHRLIAQLFIPNPYMKKEIDHIDRDKTNNRITNLRWVNRCEQMNNIGKYANNTTGFSNISFHKRDKKYIYNKTVEGFKIDVRFDTLSEAVKFKESYKYDNNYITALNPNNYPHLNHASPPVLCCP